MPRRPVVPLLAALLALGPILADLMPAAAETPPPAASARHRVDMGGNRFVPRLLRIASGDTVDFVNGAGGPHNVAFWADSLPRGSRDAISRQMPDSIAPLVGSLMIDEEQAWTMVFAGVPPGRYPYYCLPHLVGGMVGEIEVRSEK